jgi:hypothetical protein
MADAYKQLALDTMAEAERRREGAARLCREVGADDEAGGWWCDLLAELSAGHDVGFRYPLARCGGCGEWRMASDAGVALCLQCEEGA